MTRKTLFGIILSLILFVLIVDLFFVHILFPLKKKAFMDSLFESGASSLSASLLPQGLKTNFQNTERVGPDTFRLAAEQCLLNSDLAKSLDPKTLVQILEKKFGVKTRSMTTESIRFVSSTGEGRLIQIMPAISESSPDRQLHLYQFGPNDLPIPISLEDNPNGLSISEQLSSLLKDSTVLRHEIKETVVFGNEMPALIEWENDGIKSLQIAVEKKLLTCKYLDCSCQ